MDAQALAEAMEGADDASDASSTMAEHIARLNVSPLEGDTPPTEVEPSAEAARDVEPSKVENILAGPPTIDLDSTVDAREIASDDQVLSEADEPAAQLEALPMAPSASDASLASKVFTIRSMYTSRDWALGGIGFGLNSRG